MILLVFGGAILGSAAAFAVYTHWNWGIFRKMNVPTAPRKPFLGCIGTYLKSSCMADADLYLLREFGANDGKVIGVCDGRVVALLVADLDLVRQVTQTRQSDFFERRLFFNEIPGLMKKSLMNLTGSNWKRMRQLMTPMFTASNLKRLQPFIEQCSLHLVNSLRDGDVDAREAMRRLTLRTIASIGLGIDFAASGVHVENRFAKAVAEMFGFFETPAAIPLFIIPHVSKHIWRMLHSFGYRNSFTRGVDDLVYLIETEIGRRKRENASRDDLLQSLLALEDAGNITRDEVLAQSMQILLAAYDTTATTLIFFLIEMAVNPNCQTLLRDEIKQSGVAGDVEITWDRQSSMRYLDMCIQETLRLHPPFARVERLCTVPGGTILGGISIPEDLDIAIPVAALHRMPDIWTDVDHFEPARFADGVPDACSLAFFPFGFGQRNCIGERLARLEVRTAVIAIFRKFRVTVSGKTAMPVKLSKIGIIHPMEPVYLKFITDPL